jgi:hypothetical protein
MRVRRRGVGFERIGSVVPDDADLRRPQARRLRLAHAWTSVAGPALARRVQAVRIARGVLELEISDPRWAGEVKSMIPSLAGRLAGRFPDLGIRKMRLVVAGSETRAPSVEVVPETDG